MTDCWLSAQRGTQWVPKEMEHLACRGLSLSSEILPVSSKTQQQCQKVLVAFCLIHGIIFFVLLLD